MNLTDETAFSKRGQHYKQNQGTEPALMNLDLARVGSSRLTSPGSPGGGPLQPQADGQRTGLHSHT